MIIRHVRYGITLNHNETLVRDQPAAPTTLSAGTSFNHNETLVRDQPNRP